MRLLVLVWLTSWYITIYFTDCRSNPEHTLCHRRQLLCPCRSTSYDRTRTESATGCSKSHCRGSRRETEEGNTEEERHQYLWGGFGWQFKGDPQAKAFRHLKFAGRQSSYELLKNFWAGFTGMVNSFRFRTFNRFLFLFFPLTFQLCFQLCIAMEMSYVEILHWTLGIWRYSNWLSSTIFLSLFIILESFSHICLCFSFTWSS